MRTIANDDGLLALVDELFFEYHFRYDGSHNFGWGKLGKGQTVDDALRLMYRLRRAGIRSHFWI